MLHRTKKQRTHERVVMFENLYDQYVLNHAVPKPQAPVHLSEVDTWVPPPLSMEELPEGLIADEV